MMTMALEGLLIFLLMITVGYCYVLDKRLTVLRTGHADLRNVISDLVHTTHTAQEAIQGLRATADDVDVRLTSKLNEARALTGQLNGLTHSVPVPRDIPEPSQLTQQPRPQPAVVTSSASVPAPAGNNIFLRKAG